MIFKKEQNIQEKVVRKLNFKQLAFDLGIPKELTEHHRFMVSFESIIQRICQNCSKNELNEFAKKIHLIDWYNFEFENETIYQRVLNEVKNNRNFLDTDAKNEFIDRHMVVPVRESNSTALLVDKKEGKVYVQSITVGTPPTWPGDHQTRDDYHVTTFLDVYSTEQDNLVNLSYSERLDNNKQVVYAGANEYIINSKNEEISRRHIDDSKGPVPRHR